MEKKSTTSDEARASSAHARVNLPLNLDNWRDVPTKYHGDLLWFHQHILDHQMNFANVKEAVGYEWNTVYKFLKGISSGSYDKFTEAIRSYRRIVEKRQTIQRQDFAHNRITRIGFAALDYAIASNCMVSIIGESGMGKTAIQNAWRAENNHGISVYVDCPSVGGNKGFLSAIAEKVGVNKALAVPQMLESVIRSFNANRILLLDNMHRCLPSKHSSTPRAFDIVQQIFDAKGCAIAVSATARLDGQMRHSTYMFEQFTGRVGTPVYLPCDVLWSDIKPIVTQYIQHPTPETQEHCMTIANGDGHLRQLIERLKLASRIAGKAGRPLSDEHFLKAVRVRAELSKHNTNRPRGTAS